MKLTGFIVIMVSLMIFGCTSNELDCEFFKTGDFVYGDPEMGKYKINRGDNLQVEKDTILNTEIHTRVEWVSNCQYELTYDKFVNMEGIPDEIIGEKIKVKIIEVNRNRYHCDMQGVFGDSQFWMEKIN